MSIKVNSLCSKEWISAMKDSIDFRKEFDYDYIAAIDFVSYIDENCFTWKQYVSRYNSGVWDKDDMTEEYPGGLSRDDILGFIYNHWDAFNVWIRNKGDHYILCVLKDYGCDIIDFKDIWYDKKGTIFMCFCSDFICSLTDKLLGFVKVG